MPLEKPELLWENNTPYSSQFGDIYYSRKNGLLESQHVFIEQNELENRWQETDYSDFVIAETGFGTGLNFLGVCKLWQEMQITGKNLHFISFEKYPLTKEQLQQAHLTFPEISSLSEQLIKLYPKRIKGLHDIQVSPNISLTLYFGDAVEGLKSLDENFLKVDAWFFDGFSPNSNEALWSEELFSHTRKFNKLGTSFATFTSAGHVRRKLEGIGFSCHKVKGFSEKREMLRGKIEQHVPDDKKLFTVDEKPWFINKPMHNKKPTHVAVIGAGLAGSWTAYKLAKAGIKVDVFESADEIANGASGNSRGATYFKLENNQTSSLNDSQYFYLHAYLFSIREFMRLFPEQKDIWDPSGLIQLTDAETIDNSLSKIKDTDFDGVVYWIDKEEVFKKTSIINNSDGLYFPDAGSINPKKMCSNLLQQENISLFLKTHVEQVNYTGTHWQLHSGNMQLSNYDAIVIANSYAAKQLDDCKYLPLHKVRGQSTQIATSIKSRELGTVLCSKGYITPEFDGMHTIGSTFDPRSEDTSILESDNKINIEYLKKYTPDFYSSFDDIDVTAAKAALRCQTPDILPIIGPLCERESFLKTYSGIAKGQLKKTYPTTPYIPSLYLNLAHASRGLISTPYCAEIISNMILNQPIACEKRISEALSSSRFYLRDLKKSRM